MSDIEKLSEYSQMAKDFGEFKIININGDGYEECEVPVITFHPNGNCGCIELNDGSMFNIRCNHLMWAEGVCEWEGGNAIFVYGNHKGFMRYKLLVECHKDELDLYKDLIKRIEPNVKTCEIIGIEDEKKFTEILADIEYNDNDKNTVYFKFEHIEEYVCFKDSEGKQRIDIILNHKNNGFNRFYIHNHSEIIDDANGYGYKTLENAINGYRFKKNNGFVS